MLNKIKQNIPISLIISLLFLLIFSSYSGVNQIREKINYNELQKYIKFTNLANDLIYQLQQERGLTSGYMASKGKSFTKELKQQRKKSTKKIDLLKELIKNNDDSIYTFELEKQIKKLLYSLNKINKIRFNIDKFELSNKDAVSYYSSNINLLLELIEKAITISVNSELTLLTTSYILIMNIKEKAGLERALVNKIFSQGTVSKNEFNSFMKLVSSQQTYEKHFKSTAPHEYVEEFINRIDIDNTKEIIKNRNILYDKSIKDEIISSIKPYIEYRKFIYGIENHLLRDQKKLILNTKEKYQKLLKEISQYKALKFITKDEVEKLNKIQNLFINYINIMQTILESSKRNQRAIALDTNTIIKEKFALKALNNLETNLYASEKNWFKYSTKRIDDIKNIEDQLLSQLQFTVKERNETINFWLIAEIVIVIILLIIIFMMINIFNELIFSKKELNENNIKLKSILSSYDKNVLYSSTDLNGIITDVSKSFCYTSGYTREELIGQNHNIVRHPDMSVEIYKELWKLLTIKKEFTLELKNIKKDGNFFWVNSYFAPKYDKNDNHIGYTAVRDNITNRKAVESLQSEILDTQKDVIFTMGAIGETRSKETGQHVKRVAEYSKLLYLLIGASDEEAELLKMASPMHDIGKVGIPDNILNKPGKLTSSEWTIMQTHAQMGYDMLKNSKREILQLAATVALTHHERYDGGGYPKGLFANEIPIVGRITALADVFDALGSDRCYKKAWDLEKILELIKKERGKQFDPQLVDLFLENLDQFLGIRLQYSENVVS